MWLLPVYIFGMAEPWATILELYVCTYSLAKGSQNDLHCGAIDWHTTCESDCTTTKVF